VTKERDDKTYHRPNVRLVSEVCFAGRGVSPIKLRDVCEMGKRKDVQELATNAVPPMPRQCVKHVLGIGRDIILIHSVAKECCNSGFITKF